MTSFRWLFVPSLILFTALPSDAAEHPNQEKQKTTYLTVEAAGADFAAQGEYVGTLTIDGSPIDVGVQVIARGDGQFDAVAYPGGLPGDGWQGGEKFLFNGQREGSVVTIAGQERTAVIDDGVMSVTSSGGAKLGELKRTVRMSKTLLEKPPADAVVLFDGSSADEFKGGKISSEGFLMQGTTSLQKFADFRLHFEFQLSFMPYARGQARSNSGVYLQGRYECQILDSFGLDGKDNECGGIYGIKPPKFNMCYPPLSWQTYDIDFTAARFSEEGNVEENARMSVWHNGVKIQDNIELPKATRAAPLQVGPEPGPIYIQDHGNQLRFRNIWVVRK